MDTVVFTKPDWSFALRDDERRSRAGFEIVTANPMARPVSLKLRHAAPTNLVTTQKLTADANAASTAPQVISTSESWSVQLRSVAWLVRS